MAFGSALGLQKSLEFLNETGVDKIWAHNDGLRCRLEGGLEHIGAETPAQDESQAVHHPSSITTFHIPGRDTAELVSSLKESNVHVSNRGGQVRVSPHLYNGTDDIEALLAALPAPR